MATDAVPAAVHGEPEEEENDVSETIVSATCRCGGYGQCHDAEAERETGRCHVPFEELLSESRKSWLDALQEAILLLPCQEGRGPGSGVELDSTIQHAPTCPAHYITAVARALERRRPHTLANDLLLLAYRAVRREGWEEGPTEGEVWDWIVDHLTNEGIDPSTPAGKARYAELVRSASRLRSGERRSD